MTQARDLADGKFDTDTLVVDAANNRIGVGTASPAVNLDIVEDSASTDAILGITAGTGGRAQIRSEAQSDGTSSVLSFHTMSSSNTSEVGRWLAGGGLTFNGDTAAANALDDYEVGSISGTPTVGTNMTGTLSFSAALYVKVGDLVHIEAQIQGGSVTSSGAESSLVLTLPFATSVNSSAQVFNVWWTNARSNGWAVSNTSGDATGLFVAISPELNTSTGSTSVNVSGTYRAA